MIYAEAAFFDRAPVAHCAARDEADRLARIARQLRRAGRSQPRRTIGAQP